MFPDETTSISRVFTFVENSGSAAVPASLHAEFACPFFLHEASVAVSASRLIVAGPVVVTPRRFRVIALCSLALDWNG